MIANESHGEKRRVFKDAGRVCPIDYHLDESLFAADPSYRCETLYVVGGLYGNPFALDEITRMAAAEEIAERDRARLEADPNLECVVVNIARKEALDRGIALDVPEGDGGVDGPMGA